MQVTFAAAVWIYPGEAAWHFVTLTKKAAREVHDVPVRERRGFGSRRVQVMIGSSTWTTSIFPESKSGLFILPIKREIRSAEGIEAGDRVTVALTLL